MFCSLAHAVTIIQLMPRQQFMWSPLLSFQILGVSATNTSYIQIYFSQWSESVTVKCRHSRHFASVAEAQSRDNVRH